jgi:uncharacterized SAM-binding protein YcdF (DUF218 family)
MALLKSMVALALFPLTLASILIALGLVLLWFSRRQRSGRMVATTGLAILLVASYGAARPTLKYLERSYPPASAADVAQARWIVVLGGGTYSDPALPVTARLGGSTLARLIEGIRLQRQAPGSRLLLSGAAVYGYGSDAQAMSAVALSLGVPAASIVLDDASPDTETQAANIARIVQGEPFVLVTSALHLPRAMALFRKAGMAPIPGPTQYIAQSNVGWSPSDFYPDIGSLSIAQIVENELLGMAWARLRGRI